LRNIWNANRTFAKAKQLLSIFDMTPESMGIAQEKVGIEVSEWFLLKTVLE
jgi:hypothetical protein